MKRVWMVGMCVVGCAGDGGSQGEDGGVVGTFEDCGHGRIDQLLSGASAPALPATVGALPDALDGLWQHTWIRDGSGSFDAVSDDTMDIRFAVDVAADGGITLLYCQQVDVLGDEVRVNAVEPELDGDTLIMGTGFDYRVLATSEDVLVWENVAFAPEAYVLQRL